MDPLFGPRLIRRNVYEAHNGLNLGICGGCSGLGAHEFSHGIAPSLTDVASWFLVLLDVYAGPFT